MKYTNLHLQKSPRKLHSPAPLAFIRTVNSSSYIFFVFTSTVALAN